MDPFESIAFWVLEQATEFSLCNGAQVLWIDLYVGLWGLVNAKNCSSSSVYQRLAPKLHIQKCPTLQ